MGGVNHIVRRRPYGARDKEELINSINNLHKEGFSQVDIAKKLNISRGTIKRSTKMCNDLIVLGVGPRKTGIEKWINFNKAELQWAFLRGFFDADGHIRVYQRNGYQKARIGFTGNPDMLKGILTFLKSKGFAENVNSITPKQGCSDLYLSSTKELALLGK
jgi:hypothetical protein